MTDDIVREFLTLVRAEVPEVPRERFVVLERHMRLKWGGCDVYVKRGESWWRQEVAGSVLVKGGNLEAAAKKAGVGPRQVYRLLEKKQTDYR